MALKIGVVGLGGIGNKHADCHANNAVPIVLAVTYLKAR